MSESKLNGISCAVIGAGSLAIRCSEILLSANFDVRAIVSIDKEVKKWARENGIVSLVSAAELAHDRYRPFEFLFSIVNDEILSKSILDLPEKKTINYHDAPLPKYAGIHATSWALMNGETEHGISWHVVSEKVDAGDILVQIKIPIENCDTAITLNTKCFEAALIAFSKLIEDISSRSVAGRKQDLQNRTFFGRYKRPVGGGVITWDKPVASISNLVRGLTFGSYPNSLGVPKLVIGNEIFIISEIDVHHSEPNSVPGTIVEMGADFMTISGLDGVVRINHLRSLDGSTVSIPDLRSTYSLDSGCRLPILEVDAIRRIEGIVAAISRSEDYWLNKLLTSKPISPPFSKNAISAGAREYSRCPMPIPPDFSGYLKQVGRNDKFCEAVITAFGALLVRLGGDDIFDVGYSDSELIGEIADFRRLFSTQTPMRVEVDGRQPFADLLESLIREIASVDNHKTYLYDLVARSPELRALSDGRRPFEFPTVVARLRDNEEFEPVVGNELVLVISERGSECFWLFDGAKIDAESVSRLTDYFTTLLVGIAVNPGSRIDSIQLLGEDERRQLLIDWNATDTGRIESGTISRSFEDQVARDPNATALISGEERLSYLRLNERSNQLAHYLRSLGVGPEVLVGICFERSITMIVSILAVLKAGGAYVPLDPSYPRERLGHMLADSNAPILLTNERLVNTFQDYQGKVVSLDRRSEDIAQQSDENVPLGAEAANLAYVIYTSGSTGRPKGVAIEHRSALVLLRWAKTVFTNEQLRGTLQSTSICFDLSVFEMFLPLVCGGSIILVENLLHLPHTPAANEVTLINTVPSAISELLRINGVPPSVRVVNLAGEPLRTSLVQQIYALGTVEKVFDLYGPTEDTTYSTFKLRGDGIATIGRPIADTQAYVLDRNLQPTPVGIAGELYLAGSGLARGYLNLPELTAERFLRDPFVEDHSARMYRTGDLVRYLQNGDIEYLGRIDNQVKIRGFRIELGEIESILSSHSNIKELVVVAREDVPGDKRLVAYFVAHNIRSVSGAELRDFLSDRLPNFMIPSAFVELDDMPLTQNGKVDRKALPLPTKSLSEAERKSVNGRDAVEARLVQIWEKLLRIQPIGVKDDFFELGGNSLLAIRMFVEVEGTFGKSVPLATLFEAGTIEKLANILRQEGWAAPESSLVPIQPDGTRPPFFCIHAKGGNVLFYRDLAKHLGKDQPFYGIQARRLAGRQVGHGTVEEMAAFYINEIQSLQPSGPYYLGGSSFGGLGAFEIAQQLHRRGEEVALLALFDTGTPDYPKLLPNTDPLRSRIYRWIRQVQHHKDSLAGFNSKERTDYILGKLRKVNLQLRRRINNTYKKAVRKLYVATKGSGSIPKQYIQLEDQIWKAGQIYLPKVYPGKLTLFRASNQPLGIEPDEFLGWETLVAGGIDVHEVPGHHGSIVAEPYVRVLATKLTESLESAYLRESVGSQGDPISGARSAESGESKSFAIMVESSQAG